MSPGDLAVVAPTIGGISPFIGGHNCKICGFTFLPEKLTMGAIGTGGTRTAVFVDVPGGFADLTARYR
jgi:hypothetical protein